MTDRIAYSPKEFAALFGKEQTWAYRLIYAEKIKIITQFGNKLIPASEVERLLESADLHDESKKSTRGRRKEKDLYRKKSIWSERLTSQRKKPRGKAPIYPKWLSTSRTSSHVLSGPFGKARKPPRTQ